MQVDKWKQNTDSHIENAVFYGPSVVTQEVTDWEPVFLKILTSPSERPYVTSPQITELLLAKNTYFC